MRLFAKWFCHGDDEHVERLRRGLAQFDRWRPWLIGLHAVNLLILVGILVSVTVALDRLPQHPLVQPGWILLAAGACLGATLGIFAVKITHGLVMALFGFRNERLLVKYYDETQALRNRR